MDIKKCSKASLEEKIKKEIKSFANENIEDGLMDNRKIREPYLDIAKGIGILLVVFGHSFPDENSLMGISNIYCQLIKDIIYSFHMPLFFLISGYLSISVIGNKKKLIEKGMHLLIPYLTMSILYIPLRLFASGMALSNWSVKDTWKILVGVSPNGGGVVPLCFVFG